VSPAIATTNAIRGSLVTCQPTIAASPSTPQTTSSTRKRTPLRTARTVITPQ